MGVTRVYVKDARRLERVNEIKAARRRMSWFPFVFSHSGFEKVSLCLTRLIVGYRSCNEKDFDVFDVSAFQFLRKLRVGSRCFKWVKEVKMVGMSELESVVIGMNSFTKHKNDCGNDPNRYFHLKNCPKLKSLKMGHHSFSDYSVCQIENVDALEVIEMGDLNESSENFYYASLELKSILIHIE